jgi:universal stress protein A
MGYKHILAAIDLSEESAQVLDKARAVADLTGAVLSLVTVVKPLTQVYGGLDVAPLASGGVSFEDQAMKQATAQVNDLGERYQVDQTRRHILVGAPAREVRELAELTGADLIVIGTHGRHGLGLLLGSTANAVLHGIDCDALVVRVRFEA